MNPQQDYLGPTNNPYDFIINPSKPPKKKFGIGGFDPRIIKIFMVLGGLFFVMVIVAIIMSFAAAKTVGAADLIALAQTQQEIIRVANTGNSSAIQQTTKNLAITTEFTMKTQQAQLLELLAKEGKKVEEKQLGLKQDATTDLKLKEAKQTSTFDITFSQILEDQLRSYANTSNAFFEKTAKESQRDLFSTQYIQTQLLISQVPYTRDALGAN